MAAVCTGGALLGDGSIVGEDLVCGVHGWDYRATTGVSAYDDQQRLHKFSAWVENGALFVDGAEIAEYERAHPQPFDRDAYQGVYADPHGGPEEPHVGLIGKLADSGLPEGIDAISPATFTGDLGTADGRSSCLPRFGNALTASQWG